MNFKFKTKRILSFLLILTMMISTLAFNVMASTTFKFGSAETELTAGEYTLPVKLMNASNIANASMAGSCIVGGSLKVDDNGNATVYVDLQAVSVFGITAFASDWKIFQSNQASGDTVNATVEKTDADGNTTQISFAVPNNTYDGVYLNMSVSAMGMSPDAYLALDYTNATKNVNPFAFGSAETVLQAGEYTLPVKLMNASNIANASMAGSCIVGGSLKVDDNGNATVYVDLQAVSVFGITAFASDWKIFQSNQASGDTVNATVEKTDADGNTTQISFAVPNNTYDGVYLNMSVSAMGMSPDAYLALDYRNATTINSSKFYTGTSHIAQFGEYDINATVEVKDNKILSVVVTGENFNGTYATINQNMLQTAFNGLKDAFTGKDTTNAKEIYGIDAVTGATYSSNGIKDAVMNALNLTVEKENINLPKEQLKAGIYNVDIAFYSDNVAHSLIENEKAKATITVDNNGNMTLSTNVINGTVKEPLYILDFNGYYKDNNLNNNLSCENAIIEKTVTDYTDENINKGTTVVTKVSFPLEGNYSIIYNTNAKMYVPAMKALNGNISGVQFENGKFNTDCFVKVYWDGIERIGDLPVKYGDIDNDGSITADDASLLLQKVLNSTKVENINIADVDCDGIVSSTDVANILQKSLDNTFVMKCEEN